MTYSYLSGKVFTCVIIISIFMLLVSCSADSAVSGSASSDPGIEASAAIGSGSPDSSTAASTTNIPTRTRFSADTAVTDPTGTGPAVSEQYGTSVRSAPERQKDKVIENWEEYDASSMPLVAAIPEKGIYLYAVKPAGKDGSDLTTNSVALYVGDNIYHYNWLYMTPRFILPQLQTGDFDSDGKDELSVVLYVGSGTGVSIEDLHVIELQDATTGVANSGNPPDNVFLPDDYAAQLRKAVSFKTYSKSGILMGRITVSSGKKYDINLKDYQSEDMGKINDFIITDSIVRFHSEGSRITAEFGVGITSSKVMSPLYVGTLFADVKYKDGKFILDNIRFEENPE